MPLRDPSHVPGLPGFPRNDQRKVTEANQLVEGTTMLALNCILQRVPFAIENPYHSLMWMVPGMKHILSLPGVTSTRVDFCQYGEKYHKKTRLVSYDLDLTAISKVCKTKDGKCSRSGCKHELLSGTVECPDDQLHLLDNKVRARAIAKSSKLKPGEVARNPAIWRTKLAAPYPEELCEALAKVMAKHLTTSDVESSEQQPRATRSILCPSINLDKPPRSHYLTHFPKHPGCEACKLSKQMKARSDKVRSEYRTHSGNQSNLEIS